MKRASSDAVAVQLILYAEHSDKNYFTSSRILEFTGPAESYSTEELKWLTEVDDNGRMLAYLFASLTAPGKRAVTRLFKEKTQAPKFTGQWIQDPNTPIICD